MTNRMSARRESSHASARKVIGLASLKLVDLLLTNDELYFTYNQRKFLARVTIDGFIATSTHTTHTRAARVVNGESHYRMPSHFTNDCVAVYWSENVRDTECHTNPSGYARVYHVRTNRTLNDLRDEYMRMYPGDAEESDDSSLRPDLSGKRARTAEPPPPSAKELSVDVVRVINDTANTVATLRVQSKAKGYKEIAHELETKLAITRTALLRVVASSDVFVHDVLLATLENRNVPIVTDAVPNAITIVPKSMPVNLNLLFNGALCNTNEIE